MSLRAIYLVPGLPHALQNAGANAGYIQLQKAMQSLATDIREAGIERIVYFSTGWISVLGQMIQARPKLSGRHLDENWYDYGALPFRFTVDVGLAKALKQSFTNAGKPTALVDYDHFPIDTGTIVAQTSLNGGDLPVTMIANHVYAGYEDSKALAGVVGSCLRSRPEATAVVVVSGLSQRFFTVPIDLREDQMSSPDDDHENKAMLNLLQQGSYQKAEDMVSAYAHKTKADMGFKALAWIRGLAGTPYDYPAEVLAYAPIYGTGAAVARFDLG